MRTREARVIRTVMVSRRRGPHRPAHEPPLGALRGEFIILQEDLRVSRNQLVKVPAGPGVRRAAPVGFLPLLQELTLGEVAGGLPPGLLRPRPHQAGDARRRLLTPRSIPDGCDI